MLSVRSLVPALAAICFATPMFGEETPSTTTSDDIIDALTDGDVDVSLRYRYEFVDEDGKDLDAHASTLRTTLGYRTKPLHGVSAYLQFENTSVIGDDTAYASGANGVTSRPTVLDAESTEVNQVYIRYDGDLIPDTVITAGRQQIIYGNARFVGNVGWRQNHQTFDGVKIDNKSIDNLTLSYSYIANANNIRGGNAGMNTHIGNGVYEFEGYGKLEGYAYLIDYEDKGSFGNSRATLGARFSGAYTATELPVTPIYDAEYASQSDYGDNPNEVSSDYYVVEGGVKWEGVSFLVGYETLEGESKTDKFITPLATGHKFNGWADKFLATPDEGLTDLYFTIKGPVPTIKGLSFGITYHEFSEESGSDDLGDELDVVVTYKSSWKQVFGAKAAIYSGESNDDVTKVWLWTGYKF